MSGTTSKGSAEPTIPCYSKNKARLGLDMVRKTNLPGSTEQALYAELRKQRKLHSAEAK